MRDGILKRGKDTAKVCGKVIKGYRVEMLEGILKRKKDIAKGCGRIKGKGSEKDREEMGGRNWI